MSIASPRIDVDVRSLPSTREVTMYEGGGLFPVLVITPDGTAVSVLRGGAGHVGQTGRLEVCRSLDNGHTWSPPSVIVDTEADDRNPAVGLTQDGSIVLVYCRCTNYDDSGTYIRNLSFDEEDHAWEIMATRSHDAGLTWEKPYPVQTTVPRPVSSFGKIVTLADGTLLMALYNRMEPAAGSEGAGPAHSVYLVRSEDDGRTWGEATLLADEMNETGLLALPDGELLAAIRSDDDRSLSIRRSRDQGRTWTEPVATTGRNEHPADLVRLSNGDILLTYGNRNPPYRVEGLISKDGGQSWLDVLLTFSGSLYGYDVEASRRTDLGYPSSVVRETTAGRQGITAYYYTPSIREGITYQAQDYRAVSLAWNEEELLTEVQHAIGESGSA